MMSTLSIQSKNGEIRLIVEEVNGMIVEQLIFSTSNVSAIDAIIDELKKGKNHVIEHGSTPLYGVHYG